jgi:hypothetical protein
MRLAFALLPLIFAAVTPTQAEQNLGCIMTGGT